MACHELWLTYHQTSHPGCVPTTQLIDLNMQTFKFHDLEDVLEYVFSQGYIDPKLRSVSYWERKDGGKITASYLIDDLLKEGVGICEQTALRLVVDEPIPALWFTYVYVHGGPVDVTQRIKLSQANAKFEKLAHVTNHIFSQGYLAPGYRACVHWEDPCGKRIPEHVFVDEVISWNVGLTEASPLKLVIDQPHWAHFHHHHDVHTLPYPPRCDVGQHSPHIHHDVHDVIHVPHHNHHDVVHVPHNHHVDHIHSPRIHHDYVHSPRTHVDHTHTPRVHHVDQGRATCGCNRVVKEEIY